MNKSYAFDFCLQPPVPALSPFKVSPPTLSNSVYVLLEPSLSILLLFLLRDSKRKKETTLQKTTTNQEDAAEENKSHKPTTNQIQSFQTINYNLTQNQLVF